MPSIPHGSRNPRWRREEIILVLHLYKQHGGPVPLKISQDYNKYLVTLAMINGTPIKEYEKFRSPDSVNLRISNFIALDDSFPDKKGLYAKSKVLVETWNEFKNNFPALEDEAKDILDDIEKFQKSIKISAKGNPYEDYVKEGRMRVFLHKRRERNPAIVKKKKDKVFKEKGFLSCEACEFIFLKTYGKHSEDKDGRSFIECHHDKPLSEMKNNDITSLSDLSLVCSNCHRMIHNGGGCLTIEELKEIIKEHEAR